MHASKGDVIKYTTISERLPIWREEDQPKVPEEKQSMDDMLSMMEGIAKSVNSKDDNLRTTPPKLLEDGSR